MWNTSVTWRNGWPKIRARPASTCRSSPWISGAPGIVVPGDVASEYQIRVPVTSVEEMYIQNEKIYMLIVEFGLNTPNPLRFPLYAPERVCKIVPQAGDEIDAIIWLQGRIID